MTTGRSLRFDVPVADAVIEWCRHVREVQLRLGDHWVVEAIHRRLTHQTALDARTAFELESAWSAIDAPVRDLIRATQWRDMEPDEPGGTFDFGSSTRDDQLRLVELSQSLFGKDALLLIGDPDDPETHDGSAGGVEWLPIEIVGYNDTDLTETVLRLLREELHQSGLASETGLVFEHQLVAVRPANRPALRFLMSRRRRDWFVTAWPSQLDRWSGLPRRGPRRGGAGGDGAGVREPRRPIVPSLVERDEQPAPPAEGTG